MDEQPNLRDFLDEVSSFSDEAPVVPVASPAARLDRIGQVVEIAGSGSQVALDTAAVLALQSHSDPSLAMHRTIQNDYLFRFGRLIELRTDPR